MPLRGVDISNHQKYIDIGSVPGDFVIVKATGGIGFEDRFFERNAKNVLDAGKLLGVYHFAHDGDEVGTARQEADFFLRRFAPYKGKAIPVLDFEQKAQSLPVSWAKEWLDIVAAETGARPWFYAYASYLNSRDHSLLHGYPLWMASYLNRYSWQGYQSNPDQIWPIAGWNYLTAYQYTSKGRLPGYGNDLDLDIFYGDEEDWRAMCGTGRRRKEIRIDCANVAATIHADMCNDEANGYSWSPRHGEDGLGVKTLVIDGRSYSYDRGSWDCSSSVIKAWQEALRYTEHEGALDGATYTGNMRSVFSRSGLFDVWDTSSTSAVRGDVYLNDQYHTAMCQDGGHDGVLGYDALSEFCISENGTVYGVPGDQTGREAYIHGFYDRPWDCTLHYNGGADVIGYEEEVDDLKEVTNIGGEVFRLYKEGRHMLTTSEAERNELEKRGWKYEGVAFTAPKGGVAPVYRMAKGGDHVFTCSFEEAKALQGKDWEYEGVPFFGAENGKAVYRLYKDNRHLFTADKREYDELKKRGWTQEGVAWRC